MRGALHRRNFTEARVGSEPRSDCGKIIEVVGCDLHGAADLKTGQSASMKSGEKTAVAVVALGQGLGKHDGTYAVGGSR